jgi:death-on-curing family protein
VIVAFAVSQSERILMPELRTLSVEEVLQIHDILVEDFAGSPDPIYPPGVKSLDLLSSAVSRQFTSLGGRLKYPDVIPNAATLTYGLCCDHPFHNGNKRTALVALLVHLDRNKLTLHDTRQKDLFDMIINVADHSIGLPPESTRRGRTLRQRRRRADDEVSALATWIEKRAEKVTRGEKPVTYRELRKILEAFGYSLQNPKGNRIDIVKQESVTVGIFRRTQVIRLKHIGSIPYPGDHQEVGLRILKDVRRNCRLTEEDGYDTEAFYNQAAVIDAFVNRYRTILRRLARR